MPLRSVSGSLISDSFLECIIAEIVLLIDRTLGRLFKEHRLICLACAFLDSDLCILLLSLKCKTREIYLVFYLLFIFRIVVRLFSHVANKDPQLASYSCARVITSSIKGNAL